ncbi:hypothetical protein KRR55_20115 [Paeniglutamicibacter sp. ABSL32-1]|uniref:hypothetical protein n=1 Tax=Paeniglutamicibacter quisquiliarum TaxID=2849498 RepID=UPI001C2D2CFD|nr:hypothetical protein [Paeniglutamicibacter quisquiliarum]MBV1781408.1 hypothetical protein [Paeniglutamicibacter quisquiliarum]
MFNVDADDEIVGSLWIGRQSDADFGKRSVWDSGMFDAFQHRRFGVRKLYESPGNAPSSIQKFEQL